MEGLFQLRNMPFEALASVVSRYPWFGAAQKILCEQMSRMGGAEMGHTQYLDAAMHVPARSTIATLLRGEATYQDADITTLLKKYVKGEPETAVEDAAGRGVAKSKFRGVGDYFSVEQYEEVRQGDNDWIRNVSSHEGEEPPVLEVAAEFGLDFCTETLAQIYAEQGYNEKAKEIYSKLILAYPEKSVYFAALIEKLN